jgi:hypothetical protein
MYLFLSSEEQEQALKVQDGKNKHPVLIEQQATKSNELETQLH